MISADKALDVICIGRVAVDLYAQQIGSKLEDVSSFAKYIGGSSGNVAYGAARQGLKSGMLARVGDEHMGRFIREELTRAGVDTRYLITDSQRLTALVMLGIKDQQTFPLIFYRDNCADMALTSADIDENYIASARSLAITGTHLSHTSTRDAVLTALQYARKHGLRVALDIDYRPVLWGLTSLGDGETRYIASPEVTHQLQQVLGWFDLIVGTEEEFHIAGGSTDTLTALKNVRKISNATLVCKRGALGCSVFDSTIPDHLDEGLNCQGVQVEVLNVLGAGDAFMSGLLRGWLNNESWEQACHYANACGALVVSRHGCAPAMPTKLELDNYSARTEQVFRPDQDKSLNHLHRVTTREKIWHELCIFAFDHRQQLIDMAIKAGANTSRIPHLKQLLLTAMEQTIEVAGLKGKSGLLADTSFGQAALNAATGKNYWIGRPIELPGSRPLRFEHGDLGSQLVSWPKEHIAKCLVFYHPDDEIQLRLTQEQKIQEAYQACCVSGHEFLLELILPSTHSWAEKHYINSVRRFYHLGIFPDWWKLPPMSAESWQQISALIEHYDPHCRGILLLGLDAPQAELRIGFEIAAQFSWIKGFAIGRTIFGQPSADWFNNQIDDQKLINQVKDNYLALITLWRQSRQNCRS